MGWLCLAGLFIAVPAFTSTSQRAAPKRLTAPVPHSPTAEELFVKVLHSDALFSYRGRQITTYWRTGRAADTLIFHRPPEGRRIEYLNPEPQHGRLIVSDGKQQWQYDPHRKELRYRRLSPGALDEDDFLSYTLLRANYLLNVLPQPRTWADRKSYLVTIKRLRGHTLARRLWIDAGSGVILKRDIYRENGRLAVTVAFSDITYHSRLPQQLFDLSHLQKTPGVRTLRTGGTAETPIPLASLTAQLAGKAFAPGSLAGFRLVGASKTVVSGKPLLHLRYSDGLNLVSLFEQRRMQAGRPTLVKGMRATRIGTVPGHVSHRASLTTLNWDTATLNITLMGELGAETLGTLALAAVQKKEPKSGGRR